MFPSLDTNGYDDLFDPFEQTTLLPSPSFPSSSNFLDESFLISQFLLQQQDVAVNVVEQKKKKNNVKCVDGNTSEKLTRRRTSRKRDGRSKICTAQGPRDRRMRLSLQIARKFFDLQDMLGFDKASKTIEWLFSKSKSSIKRIKETVAASGGGRGDYEHHEKVKDETLKITVSKKRAKAVESSCKTKESREKARKRARERTVMKMKMRLSGLTDTLNTSLDSHQDTRTIKIASGVQVEGENQEQEWSNTNQMDSVRIIEKFLGLTSDSSSSSILGDSKESYTSSIRATTSTEAGMVIPIREHNTTSIDSVDEEENPISSFSLYDYICH